MATRKNSNSNNHLEEAMALLIRDQAAFVEQIARNDQERLKLQRSSDESQRRSEELERETKERFGTLEREFGKLERETKEQFARVEERLSRIETILLQLPKAIKKEIGFKPRP